MAQIWFALIAASETFALAAMQRRDGYVFDASYGAGIIRTMNTNRDIHDLRDPREAEIELLLGTACSDSCSVVDRLMSMPGLFADEQSPSPEWNRAVSTRLETMLSRSMRAAIEAGTKRAA